MVHLRCTRHENSQAVSNIVIREASILCHPPYNQCSIYAIHPCILGTKLRLWSCSGVCYINQPQLLYYSGCVNCPQWTETSWKQGVAEWPTPPLLVIFPKNVLNFDFRKHKKRKNNSKVVFVGGAHGASDLWHPMPPTAPGSLASTNDRASQLKGVERSLQQQYAPLHNTPWM